MNKEHFAFRRICVSSSKALVHAHRSTISHAKLEASEPRSCEMATLIARHYFRAPCRTVTKRAPQTASSPPTNSTVNMQGPSRELVPCVEMCPWSNNATVMYRSHACTSSTQTCHYVIHNNRNDVGGFPRQAQVTIFSIAQNTPIVRCVASFSHRLVPSLAPL